MKMLVLACLGATAAAIPFQQSRSTEAEVLREFETLLAQESEYDLLLDTYATAQADYNEAISATGAGEYKPAHALYQRRVQQQQRDNDLRARQRDLEQQIEALRLEWRKLERSRELMDARGELETLALRSSVLIYKGDEMVSQYNLLGDPLLRMDAGAPRMDVTRGGQPVADGEEIEADSGLPFAAIDFALVDESGLDRLEITAFEVEQVEAVFERHHCAAVPPERHRADLARHVPGSYLAPIVGAAKHPAVKAVDEVEALLGDIPEGSLSKRGLDVDENLDPHCHPPCAAVLSAGETRLG